jgi:hypothetical protein
MRVPWHDTLCRSCKPNPKGATRTRIVPNARIAPNGRIGPNARIAPNRPHRHKTSRTAAEDISPGREPGVCADLKIEPRRGGT